MSTALRFPESNSLLSRYRSRLEHQHGWEVELRCPRCGVSAVPRFLGWTPATNYRLDEMAKVYADLACPRCAADLRTPAEEKLVELFGPVPIVSGNKRLLAGFVVAVLVLLGLQAVLVWKGFGPPWSVLTPILVLPSMFIVRQAASVARLVVEPQLRRESVPQRKHRLTSSQRLECSVEFGFHHSGGALAFSSVRHYIN